MASIAQQYIFINRDYNYFTEWAIKKGLTGYFNNRKKNNYNLLMMKYKKDRTETLKNFYNSQRKSANVRLERLFNEGLAQQQYMSKIPTEFMQKKETSYGIAVCQVNI